MKDKIRKFIVERFLYGKGDIKDEDSLFESNIVDSFGIMELCAFIEKEFNVSINPSEITVENFDSIKKMCAFIESKKSKK